MSTPLSATYLRDGTFHLFPNLPIELRLNIIDKFVATLKATTQPTLFQKYERAPRKQYGLAKFAIINLDWQGRIEALLFESLCLKINEIADFHRIVPAGPRSLLVQRLHLNLDLQYVSLKSEGYPRGTGPATVVAEILALVFDTLRGWDDRLALDDAHLLEFCLDIGGDMSFAMVPNLSRLPEVAVIGSIFISLPNLDRNGWLHATSAVSLLRQAPNV